MGHGPVCSLTRLYYSRCLDETTRLYYSRCLDEKAADLLSAWYTGYPILDMGVSPVNKITSPVKHLYSL